MGIPAMIIGATIVIVALQLISDIEVIPTVKRVGKQTIARHAELVKTLARIEGMMAKIRDDITDIEDLME